MRKIALVLFVLLLTFSLFAAEIIRYVDPDAIGGGTGLDWTNAYTSLNAWEAAEQQDLTDNGGDWMHVYVRALSGTADTIAVFIATWTLAAANYILIEAAVGHEAIASSYDINRYRLEVTDDEAIFLSENYIRIKNLQIKGIYSSTDNINVLYVNSVETSYFQFEGIRLEFDGGLYRGIVINDSDASADIFNCIINGGGRYAIWSLNGATVNVYNNTVYGTGGNTANINQSSGTLTVKNTASWNSGNDFNGTITIDYCASDDGDGGNPVTPANWANVFENAAGGDFRLKSTDTDLHDAGTDDPGSGLYSDDIEGTTRVSIWDIGAFEFVAPAVGIVSPVISSDGIHSVIFGGQVITGALFLINICLFIILIRTYRKMKYWKGRALFYEDSDILDAMFQINKYLEGGP